MENKIIKKEISEKTENTNNDNSKEIVKKTNTKAVVIAAAAVLAIVGAVGAVVLGNNNSTVKNNVNTSSFAYNYEPERSTMPKEGKLSETITFRLVENTLYIDGTGEIYQGLFTEYSNTLQYIKYIILSDGITEIGDYTFDSCENLKSITIPGSVTKIGNYTFKNCKSLKSITIPSSVTEIGEGAFWNCDSLTIQAESDSCAETYAKKNNISFANSSKCGENASYKLIGNTLYIDGTGTVTGKNGGTSCFKSLSDEIEDVIIADGITEIGAWAFENCTSLKSIVIPSSVTEIGEYAFWRCGSLESITIPDSVTKIGSFAFSECTSLESITIPSGVTEIERWCFSGCTSLKSITIPSSVKEIGSGAFKNCTSLESITIPSSVKEIEEYDYAFENCNNLTIHGEAGSYAEIYANRYHIKFKSI